MYFSSEHVLHLSKGQKTDDMGLNNLMNPANASHELQDCIVIGDCILIL
jgi:hypothetical protein